VGVGVVFEASISYIFQFNLLYINNLLFESDIVPNLKSIAGYFTATVKISVLFLFCTSVNMLCFLNKIKWDHLNLIYKLCDFQTSICCIPYETLLHPSNHREYKLNTVQELTTLVTIFILVVYL
jgi:hypothetical protein